MKQIFDRAWAPVAGALSSLGFTSLDQVANPDIYTIPATVGDDKSPFYYLLIGFLGALGGLALKLAWSACKRQWPKLKNLEK